MADDRDRGIDSNADTAMAPTEGHAPVDTVRFTPGTLLAGRYRIISPLGKGGMGEVYRADDIRLGQPVALKFLPAAFAADSERLERLVDEVRIGRQISHPNVCRLYDIAEAGGHHFLVMEYVDGEDLASLLRRIGRLPGDKALEIARGLCAGLAAAHDKGVIHRDLKPANVMIDGKGHARIADFGIAALSGGGSVTGLAGTPSYMAPEQLSGEGASTRSDVFALGLVLREMLTGERVFEAKSLDAIRALHAQSKPLGLSSSVKDVDPAVERVILQCLARDPRERPASARIVLLSLPGGDPLQAAVLAGETPSPEMVAAAGKVGDLRPAVAWLAFGAGLLGLLAITALTARGALYRLAPLPKSPELLVERAKEVLARVGHTAAAVDSAQGFVVNFAYLEDIERNDPSPARWGKLRTAHPGAFGFYYRQSPSPLFSKSWIPNLPWLGPPELGRITRRDPPFDAPGMAEVVLDAQGRLTRFAVVPPLFDPGSGPWPGADWTVLFAEAGLDPRLLIASTSHWSAPVDSDSKAAWDGVYPDQPGVRFHIEAAAYHGRPVLMEVRGPWERPTASAASPDRDSASLLFALSMVFLSVIPIVGALIVLVRRNIRMGRGDRRGAVRLAVFTFGTLTLAQAFRADHTRVGSMEYALLLHIVSQGCYAAIAVWSFYMAVEPAVRRRWPHTLISWTRLLGGRFRDPLVARDTLVGVILGLGVTLTMKLGDEAPAWFGGPPSIEGSSVLSTLNSPRHLVYYLLMGACVGVVYSLSLLFQLYLIHALVRRVWLAQAVLLSFVFMVSFAQADDPLWGAVVSLIFAGLVLFGLTRFGPLCSAFLIFTFLMFLRSPLTLDGSVWYAGRSFAVLGFFVALLAATAYASLGGKPLFGKALLDD